MREHLKLIYSTADGARKEVTQESGRIPDEAVVVHSALSGDGQGRYADVTKQANSLIGTVNEIKDAVVSKAEVMAKMKDRPEPQLQIHSAYYGIGDSPEKCVVVTDRLRELVKDDSLDIVVNNDTLAPGQNPFRGKRKTLRVRYSINGGEPVTVLRQEKEWLIIGPAQPKAVDNPDAGEFLGPYESDSSGKIGTFKHSSQSFPKFTGKGSGKAGNELYRVKIEPVTPMTAAALDDYLIRKFHISDRRLRAPMPVELRDFNRNDLAKLFAELGFTRGAEIGVAEGRYSEVVLQTNPQCELLLLVDPWHRYSQNPQNKSVEKHEFAYNETLRRTKNYPCVQIVKDYSMNAVHDVNHGSLDWAYIDGQHQFDFCMSDLIEWSKRVRSGGIVSGDDYYELDRKRWGAGPVEAVQAYTKAHGIALWFICDAPNSVDFFWVKL